MQLTLGSFPLRGLCALLLILSGDGRSYRLNDPFPRVPGGDVKELELSADGAWLVYWADVEVLGVDTLYSLPSDGSAAPVELADVAPVLFHSPPAISPDGTRVLFTTRTTFTGLSRLYSVPSDGSATPVELVGPHVSSFQISPDSARVLFRGDVFTDAKFVLCSMPIDGRAGPIAVNGPLTAQADVQEFAISPDGTRVVYRADAITNGKNELFSAQVGVAASGIKLSGTLVSGGQVQPAFHIGADGARVVYLADGLTNDVFELFRVPIDASASPLRLNAPLSGNRRRSG